MLRTASLSDPSGSPALPAAALWVQQLLTGTAAVTLAVVAVASIGYLMLAGRIDLRRSGTILAGCFILFGAGIIAQTLRNLASGGGVREVESAEAVLPGSFPSAPPPLQGSTSPFDPYSGASIPQN